VRVELFGSMSAVLDAIESLRRDGANALCSGRRSRSDAATLSPADIVAPVKLYATAEGGRAGPTPSDKLGCLFVLGDDCFDCRLLLSETGPLSPGASALVPIKFLEPEIVEDLLDGDYKVFSDGAEGTRRSELVYEEVSPKVRIEIVELELDGEPVGATSYAVQPGRSARLLAVFAAGLEMRFPRGLAMRLRVQPGKWIESGAGGKAFVGDVRVGKARIRRQWRFVGFESVDIPGASFPEAARTEERTSIVVKERGGGRRIEVRTSSVGFSVEGWGVVASEENVATWIDGVLVEETGPSRWNLVEGTVFGQSIP
jgi:hypothetical protein